MPRPIRGSVAAVTGTPGTSPVIPLDLYVSPTDVAVHVDQTNTANTWGVFHTFDDPYRQNAQGPIAPSVWTPHQYLGNSNSTSADGVYSPAPTAVQIRFTGSGSCNYVITQGGPNV
jgi:hypothetical protein